MNKINSLQNDKKALEVQAAARHYYNSADILDFRALLISILLVVLNLMFINNKYVVTFQIVWFIIFIIVENTIDKYVNKGAMLKNSFDYYIYGWKPEFSVNDNDLINKLKIDKKDFILEQIENDGAGSTGGVKDWHTNINSNWSEEKATKRAMKNNVSVNALLISRSKILLSIMILVIIAVVVLVLGDFTLYEIIVYLFITFSVISKKIIDTCISIHAIDKLNNEISTMLKRQEINNFKEIQSKIDDKRKIHFPIDYVIYMNLREKMHEVKSN